MEDSADSYAADTRNYCEQEETSTWVHAQVEDLKPTEWTDEKHSLYLKSMEATFVNQLYKSLDFLARHSQKNCASGSKSSKHKPTSIGAPSAQFKVLRNGCWSKINFMRDEPEVNQVESGVLVANPWIQHYRCSERKANRKFSPTRLNAAFAATSNQYSACNSNLQSYDQDSIGCNTEVTDQNFDNEELEEENSGRAKEMKRPRTSTDTVSSNDQVVPFENIVQVSDDHDYGHCED